MTPRLNEQKDKLLELYYALLDRIDFLEEVSLYPGNFKYPVDLFIKSRNKEASCRWHTAHKRYQISLFIQGTPWPKYKDPEYWRFTSQNLYETTWAIARKFNDDRVPKSIPEYKWTRGSFASERMMQYHNKEIQQWLQTGYFVSLNP